MTRPPENSNHPPRPTPVRTLMQADPVPHAETPTESPPRTFDSGEERWIVREGGTARTGSGGDRGAPLLLLVFEREAAPSAEFRESLAIAESLESLPDEELVTLLDRARPVPPSESPPL